MKFHILIPTTSLHVPLSLPSTLFLQSWTGFPFLLEEHYIILMECVLKSVKESVLKKSLYGREELKYLP